MKRNKPPTSVTPYDPHPLDTSGVELNPSLLALTELLAKETHEVWAKLRKTDGWRYGPKPNEAKKEHPCLVPYGALSDGEKQYDRNTAIQNLKTIVSWGYRIDEPAHPSEIDLRPTLEPRHDIARMDLSTLLALWNTLSAGWPHSVDVFRLIGERFLKLGEPLLAYDVLAEGLTQWPEDIRLRQLQGLALARSGATVKANRILHELVQQGHTDEETLGILARTYKDLWSQASTVSVQRRHLRKAFETYSQTYALHGMIWSGVNAATLALVLGRRAEAHTLARQVQARCQEELRSMKAHGQSAYWTLATLGETALLLGDWADAEERYSQAASVAGEGYGDLCSTRQNAELLLTYLGEDPAWIDRFLRVPGVLVFSGHMIDQPGRTSPRFPPQLEGAVRDAIDARLNTLSVGWAYSSAACGSDILLLEALQARHIPTHVVLPFQPEQFRDYCVALIPRSRWGARFEKVLGHATAVIEGSEFSLVDRSASYTYAHHLLYGLAAIRAAQLHTACIPMAVWDGKPGDSADGTADRVRQWQRRGHAVEIIDLARLLSEAKILLPARSSRTRKQPAKSAPRPRGISLRIMAMLFADAVGFTHLREDQIPLFVKHILGLIGKRLKRFPYQPSTVKTSGDGLFLVFDHVLGVGLFALELAELFETFPFKDIGLPDSMNFRIAVHVGPVYTFTDPITQQRTYTGTHVNRAARIEPITPPGQVYTSQAFAALTVAEGVTEFTCDYVGQTPMAKRYGTFPTYHLRRVYSGDGQKKSRGEKKRTSPR